MLSLKADYISDNFIWAHELLEKIRKTKRGKTWIQAFEIDMNKAYNRLR